MTVVVGNFLEVYTGSSACGLGQLSDISDSDCEELRGVREECFNGTVFLRDVRIGQKVLPSSILFTNLTFVFKKKKKWKSRFGIT